MDDISGRVQDAIDDLENLDEEMLDLIAMLNYYAQGMEYAKGILCDGDTFLRTIRHIKTSIDNMRVTLESGVNAVALIRSIPAKF
jgi:hypothetical protein